MSIEMDIRNDILEYLRRHSTMDEGELLLETSFEDAGIDSIDLLTMAEIVEKKYGISLSDERIAGISTFADLVDFAVQEKGGVE